MRLMVGYLDQDTWAHRLDPRVKCLWMIIAGAVGFIVPSFGWIALNLLLMLPFVFAARCTKYWLLLVAIAAIPAWFIAAVNMFWGNTVIPSGHVPDELTLGWLFRLITGESQPYLLWRADVWRWDIALTTVSCEKGLYFAFRWINMVAPAAFFIFVTRPEDFAASLTRLGLPFTVSFVVSLAVRFIPVIITDARTVYDAQRSRGARIDRGFFPIRLLRMRILFFPVLICALQHTHNMSLGMEARAFHTGRERTRFYEKSLDRHDKAAIAYSAALLGLSIIVRL